MDFIRISIVPHKFLSPGVGGWDVDFIRISDAPHKLLGPKGRRLGFGFHYDFNCTAQILSPGVGGWDVDFYKISIVPHKFCGPGVGV